MTHIAGERSCAVNTPTDHPAVVNTVHTFSYDPKAALSQQHLRGPSRNFHRSSRLCLGYACVLSARLYTVKCSCFQRLPHLSVPECFRSCRLKCVHLMTQQSGAYVAASPCASQFSSLLFLNFTCSDSFQGHRAVTDSFISFLRLLDRLLASTLLLVCSKNTK